MDDLTRTIYAGNLSDKVSEDILYELCMQAGPVESVKIPYDKERGKPKCFGFVCFQHNCTVPYAIHMLNGINLYGQNIKVQSRDKYFSCPSPKLAGVHRLFEIDESEDVKNSGSSGFNADNNMNNGEGFCENREHNKEKYSNISDSKTSVKDRLGKRKEHPHRKYENSRSRYNGQSNGEKHRESGRHSYTNNEDYRRSERNERHHGSGRDPDNRSSRHDNRYLPYENSNGNHRNSVPNTSDSNMQQYQNYHNMPEQYYYNTNNYLNQGNQMPPNSGYFNQEQYINVHNVNGNYTQRYGNY